jgi:signal transduction histidine kinase
MRRQLRLLVAATTSLVLLAFLVPLALLLRTLAEDRAVAQAFQDAQNVAVVVAVTPDLRQVGSVVDLVDQRSGRSITVFLADGHVVGAAAPGTSQARALASRGNAFTVRTAQGREVYVPVDTARGRAVVRAFVPTALLRRGVLAATAVLTSLGAALLLVAVVIADRLARGTVRPVVALAETAHRLAAGDLDARVTPAGPGEVVEVGEAVNMLARRIAELLETERDAVADLSHRLRTPLTAMRLDAEGLRDREESQRLTQDVAALERAVDTVIRAARRPVREGVAARCDAGVVVRDRVDFWAALAEEQGRPWELAVPAGSYPVRLLAEDLAAALDALLGNVFAHTPDGTAVTVSVRREDGVVRVEVADRGPGFGEHAVERGTSGAGSTGLGLDIARRTAEAAGGRFEVGPRLAGGAVVTLVLPPA